MVIDTKNLEAEKQTELYLANSKQDVYQLNITPEMAYVKQNYLNLQQTCCSCKIYITTLYMNREVQQLFVMQNNSKSGQSK